MTSTFILSISEILRNWVFSKKAISGKILAKQEKCPQFLWHLLAYTIKVKNIEIGYTTQFLWLPLSYYCESGRLRNWVHFGEIHRNWVQSVPNFYEFHLHTVQGAHLLVKINTHLNCVGLLLICCPRWPTSQTRQSDISTVIWDKYIIFIQSSFSQWAKIQRNCRVCSRG